MPDALRRGDRSGASLASEQTGTGKAGGNWRNPTPVSGRRRQGRLGESQPGRGTWNRTVILRRMERSGKEIAGCILAKVNGMGPQASFQQEASPGQHGHQRGSSPRHFRSHFLATDMRASIKCRRSANIWWCAALHAVLTRRWTETSTSTPSRFVGSWVFAGLAFFCEGSSTWKGCHCFGHGRDRNDHSRFRPCSILECPEPPIHRRASIGRRSKGT